MPAPPRAPTFPAFVDDVQRVDEATPTPPAKPLPDLSDYIASAAATAANDARAAPSPLVDMTDVARDVTGPIGGGVGGVGGDVPVVPLPVAQSRSKIKAVLLWRDPKLTGIVLGVCLVFFYLTLLKGMSVLSVLGALSCAYFVLGLVVTKVNASTGGKLDAYVARPPPGTPLLRRDAMYRVVDTVAEEVNDVAEQVRDALYCDNIPYTLGLAFLSYLVYLAGAFFSVLAVGLVGTIALFTLPLAYEKNKKQVDDTVSKASDVAVKHVERGRRVATERAAQLREVAAAKSAPLLDKAPPAAKNFAAKIGFTPTKTD